MLHFLKKIIFEEKANAIIENIIIMPLIFAMIYAIILTSFALHDKCTLEAAARRGAIYAAHCISDPNYMTITGGVEKGNLDLDPGYTDFSFEGNGKNIKPYRYILGGTDVTAATQEEVKEIIEKTRIPWRKIKYDDKIQVEAVNKIYYQDVTVSIDATFQLPPFFAIVGLDKEFGYVATARVAVDDPDEFVRNADFAVDMLIKVDDATGGNLEKAQKKIEEFATKVLDWIKV